MPTESIAAVLRLIRILDELAIPYALGGSIASSIHGEPRATADADILAQLEPREIPGLVARLTAEF